MFYTPLKDAYHWIRETLTRWSRMTTVLFQKTK